MEVNPIKIKWTENELSQNTHIVEFENTCIIIDAGCSVKRIKETTNKQIKAVFVTHGHFDHIKNIEEFDKLNVPIFANKNIVEMLNNERNNASVLFGKICKYNVSNLKLIENGQEVEMDNHKIKCFNTSGHSVDSMSFLLDNEALFSGDTVFADSFGRFDLPTGNRTELIESLKFILNLDYKTLYAGHGRPSVKEEQKINIPKFINYLV